MGLSGISLMVIPPIILLSFMEVSEGYTAVARVTVRRGMCVYKRTRIPDDSELHLTDPCEMWTCNADDHTLEITGCWVARAGPGCKVVHRKGPYPRCCPRIRCNKGFGHNKQEITNNVEE